MTKKERDRAKSARWRARHPDRAKAVQKANYARRKAGIPARIPLAAEERKRRRKASIAAWRAKNIEQVRAQRRVASARYAVRHPERERARVRAWAEVHRDRVRQRTREWARANPEKKAASCGRRRQRVAATSLTVFEQARVLAFYAIARARTRQTGIPHEVDHIMPLSKGGLHHPDNLRVTTLAENRRKNARVILEVDADKLTALHL